MLKALSGQMTNTEKKHIVIGITGGIAAYKSLSLIRLFKSAGFEVKVTATQHALEFVTPLTIETLSQNKIYTDMFGRDHEMSVQHIALAEWADVVVVAPATANIIGKLASGIADDALSTLLLATTKPIFMAPAMNSNMYAHPAVQQNLQTLLHRGIRLIEPKEGFLACGTEGKGRMEEPEKIFDSICDYLAGEKKLDGYKALVSAGPTYEPIDPVRFIGNHSSGLMGYALAEELARQGADVTLVSGPTHLDCQHEHIRRVDVTTAGEMYEQCMQYGPQADIIIMAAAVADYTPRTKAPQKIKKHEEGLQIDLVKTKDILATLGKQRREGQLITGFALETENELENAKGKLQNKNIDIIVLNSMNNPKAGFNKPTNQVTMIDRDGQMIQGEAKSKTEVAKEIIQFIISKLNK